MGVSVFSDTFAKVGGLLLEKKIHNFFDHNAFFVILGVFGHIQIG